MFKPLTVTFQSLTLNHNDSTERKPENFWAAIHRDNFLYRRCILKHVLGHLKRKTGILSSQQKKFGKLGLVLMCLKVSEEQRKKAAEV